MTNLERAAQLIEEHISTLNTASSECACCGHRRYENFNEFNRHKEMSAMARKLRERYDLSKSNCI